MRAAGSRCAPNRRAIYGRAHLLSSYVSGLDRPTASDTPRWVAPAPQRCLARSRSASACTNSSDIGVSCSETSSLFDSPVPPATPSPPSSRRSSTNGGTIFGGATDGSFGCIILRGRCRCCHQHSASSATTVETTASVHGSRHLALNEACWWVAAATVRKQRVWPPPAHGYRPCPGTVLRNQASAAPQLPRGGVAPPQGVDPLASTGGGFLSVPPPPPGWTRLTVRGPPPTFGVQRACTSNDVVGRVRTG